MSIEKRFTPEVCKAIINAAFERNPDPHALEKHPFFRYALSGDAPSAIRDLARDALSLPPEHTTEKVLPAVSNTSPADAEGSSSPPDSFPRYVGTTDGYYVVPNTLFMKAFTQFPSKFGSGSKVVDLGSGTGRNGLVAALNGADVTLVEQSDAGNKFAQSQAASLGVRSSTSVVSGLMQDWDPSPQTYDTVISITTLEHLSRPERQKLTAKIKGALKPGGLVVAAVFLDDDPGALGKDEEASETAGHVLSYLAKNELRELFSDFEIVTYSEYKKLDLSHGAPHYHSRADLIAVKL